MKNLSHKLFTYDYSIIAPAAAAAPNLTTWDIPIQNRPYFVRRISFDLCLIVGAGSGEVLPLPQNTTNFFQLQVQEFPAGSTIMSPFVNVAAGADTGRRIIISYPVVLPFDNFYCSGAGYIRFSYLSWNNDPLVDVQHYVSVFTEIRFVNES